MAGVGIEEGGTIDATSEHALDFTLDVNLKGPMRFARACVPLMRAQGGGSIVNIASQLAISARHGMPVYIGSKGGVAAFSRALAIDHAPDSIRCNSICPVRPLTNLSWRRHCLLTRGMSCGRASS